MILDHNIQPSILDQIHKLPDVFYPTGSRFFGTARIGSDYDYFVQWSLNLRTQLDSLGFKVVSTHDYGDALCISVMRRYCPVVKTGIDIQLVKDARLKDKIQKKFVKAGIIPTKEHWDIAFALNSEFQDSYSYVKSLSDGEIGVILGEVIRRVHEMGKPFTDKWPITEHQRALMKEGNYIQAIKSYREVYKTGLLEAKRAIDTIRYM